MNMLDALGFIVSGFAVVVVALSLLWMVSAAIGRAFALAARPPENAASSAAQAGQPAGPASPGIPAAHIAAIGAAVAALTNGRGRVVSVRAPGHVAANWAHEGRRDHFSSHRNRAHWDRTMPSPPDAGRNALAPASPPTPLTDRKRTQ